MSPALDAVRAALEAGEWPSVEDFSALARAGSDPSEAATLTLRYADAITSAIPPRATAEARLMESLRSFSLPPAT